MNQQQRKELGLVKVMLDDISSDAESAADHIYGDDCEFTTAKQVHARYFDDLSNRIDNVMDQVTEQLEAEQGKFDNLSESLQEGPTGERIQQAIESLETAQSCIEEAQDRCAKPDDETTVEEMADELMEVSRCLGEACEAIDDACSV